jgi:hypothetical protein
MEKKKFRWGGASDHRWVFFLPRIMNKGRAREWSGRPSSGSDYAMGTDRDTRLTGEWNGWWGWSKVPVAIPSLRDRPRSKFSALVQVLCRPPTHAPHFLLLHIFCFFFLFVCLISSLFSLAVASRPLLEHRSYFYKPWLIDYCHWCTDDYIWYICFINRFTCDYVSQPQTWMLI